MKKIKFQIDKKKYSYIPSDTVTAEDVRRLMRDMKVYENGYCEIPFAFDIETTSFYSPILDANLATMYHWQFGLTRETITGRTWEEWKRILDLINDAIPDKATLICWVQNLSFEWQFIKGRLDWNMKESKQGFFPDIFAKTVRDILYARYKKIEFRDALALTAMSLKAYQKNFGLDVGKLAGDLDYKKIRHTKSSMTKKEIAYCINDVQVLTDWIYKYINPFYNELNKTIPLTSTGIVRAEIKEEFAKLEKTLKKKLRNKLRNCQPSKEIYILWRNFLFRGGYVHANAVQCNECLEDPFASLDLKSAHPAQMLLQKFPWKFNRVNVKAFPEVLQEARAGDYAFFGIFEFKNIRTSGWHSLESRNKIIEEEGAVYENGRLVKADRIKVCLNEIDWYNYEDLYCWEQVRCTMLYQAKLEPLPDYVRKVVMKYFELKETLPKDTLEYTLSKRKLNACFGMAATSLPEREIVFDPELNELKPGAVTKTYDELVRWLVMLPQWAIWIAAYTRRDIVKSVKECGIDSIYYDTDSNKVNNFEKHREWFENFNKEKRALVDAMDIYDFDRKHFEKIGSFDLEYYGTRYKVLGCKRYMVEHDGKIQITVAGMVKGSYEKWIEAENEKRRKSGESELDLWDSFANDLKIPAPYSGKQTAIYYDQDFSLMLTDADGITCQVEEKSCCSIVDIPFSMSIDDDFIERIKALKDERERMIYKGVF